MGAVDVRHQFCQIAQRACHSAQLRSSHLSSPACSGRRPASRIATVQDRVDRLSGGRRPARKRASSDPTAIEKFWIIGPNSAHAMAQRVPCAVPAQTALLAPPIGNTSGCGSSTRMQLARRDSNPTTLIDPGRGQFSIHASPGHATMRTSF